ncbi:MULTISPECIES: hypothetical protein [Streptomyces]|uniref:hypothetical protein n=1 Tax=Streptomyces TaxID=1883 RepID=UPI001E3B49B8|nr:MULTISPECIES: hypothetical protein [Streptomyces]UFQ16701.1 hypothetical protein J2N69_17785 [Streptomyces huasconensis]WCL86301.1 hypothetical protein PPN52_17795 [Streptomyces sp. JCM 35825]
MSAAVSGKPLLVDDFRRPLTRWPSFEAAMGDELGEIGAVHVLSLTFDDKVFGTVELMRREPVSPEDDATDREMVRQAQAAARVMLPSFWRLLAHGELPLWKPSDQIDTHWGTTHQASGKLAAHLDISPEEALARLRASAFVTGRPPPGDRPRDQRHALRRPLLALSVSGRSLIGPSRTTLVPGRGSPVRRRVIFTAHSAGVRPHLVAVRGE